MRREDKVADISHCLGVGTCAGGPLLVKPAWQGSEALVGQHLADRGGTERHSLLFERLTDLVDRVVALAQRHDLLVGEALPGLPARARMRVDEELGQLAATEGMAHDAEGARRITKASGGFRRTYSVDEEGPQGLILALARGRGL